jgi:hypothetical protein
MKKGLMIWYAVLITWTLFMSVVLCHATEPIFPVDPLGECWQGVQDLAGYYPDAQFAYDSQPMPGHVWIISGGIPIDSYYGPQSSESLYWSQPERVFPTFTDMNSYVFGQGTSISRCPNTQMWEQDYS